MLGKKANGWITHFSFLGVIFVIGISLDYGKDEGFFFC